MKNTAETATTSEKPTERNEKQRKGLAECIKMLRSRQSEIEQSVNGISEEFDRTERDRPDKLDSAQSSSQSILLAGLASSENSELLQIGIALERVRRGIYGVCDKCYGNIPIRRLEARPQAIHCVPCQEKVERE